MRLFSFILPLAISGVFWNRFEEPVLGNCGANSHFVAILIDNELPSRRQASSLPITPCLPQRSSTSGSSASSLAFVVRTAAVVFVIIIIFISCFNSNKVVIGIVASHHVR
jgi:hypothetical protein